MLMKKSEMVIKNFRVISLFRFNKITEFYGFLTKRSR